MINEQEVYFYNRELKPSLEEYWFEYEQYFAQLLEDCELSEL